jgi:phosphoribosylamine--glycine ligase
LQRMNKIDLTVVAPDDPLAMGLVDMLEENGLRAFGPRQSAAEIESSKLFAKKLMKKYGIPTAQYQSFEEYDAAVNTWIRLTYPVVIKADGLALGKGVIIASNRMRLKKAVKDMLLDNRFGEAGQAHFD